MDLNGRVNIIGNNHFDRFMLHDKIPTQDTYYKAALTGNWKNNLLSNTFFSAGNIRILQNGIKAGVYKMSNKRFLIANQEEDVLKMIMRSVFLQHAMNLPNQITEQVTALNKIVLDYCVPQVYGEAKGYIKYKHDVSTLVVPLRYPLSTKTEKTLEFKRWF